MRAGRSIPMTGESTANWDKSNVRTALWNGYLPIKEGYPAGGDILRIGYQPIQGGYRRAEYSTDRIPTANDRIPSGRSIPRIGYPAADGRITLGATPPTD